MASVDAVQHSRALTTLLANAGRHTPPDGTVSVIAHRAQHGVVISVQDTFGGKSDDDLPRVFDLAWRGEHARTSGPPVVSS